MARILNGCRICVFIPRTWTAKKWTKDQVEKWVKAAGAVMQKEFDPRNTTHLVVEEQAWKNKVSYVQSALEANDNGGKVYIVSPEWLDDCLTQQRKHREKAYSWERMDTEAANEKRKKRGKQTGEGEGEEGDEDGIAGPRSHPAMLGEVLQEGTEDYVGDHDRRVLEADIAEKQRAEKEHEEAEARRKEQEKLVAEQQRKARTELMRKSAKKGRGEEFNANYHVFKDSTGFEYDCTLTKVDTITNRNERLVLTIFESNAGGQNPNHPPTYATNLHFAGTDKQPYNNILAAFGANYYTAMRMWRKAFEEKTGVSWDDRIKAHNERVRDRARDGDTPDLYSTRRGENGDVKSKTRAAEDAVPFEKRKFEYMPPLHAARGWLPDGREEVPEVLRQIRAKPNEYRDRTEQWMMSGGNGNGSDGSPISPRQSIENAQAPVQIDLTEDEPAEDDGDLSGEMEAEADAFVNSLLAGTHEWSAEDDIFNADGLTGQQQQDFVFGQDGIDSTLENHGGDQDTMISAPDSGDANFPAFTLGDETFSNFASLPKQTQLAADVGEGLLNMEHPDSASEDAAVGLVVVPETEQLEAAAKLEKRKRGEDETNGTEPAAKRFMSEEAEDGESDA